MKRFYSYFLIWILLSYSFPIFSQEKSDRPIVVIDPGHGGNDSGAIGANGIHEKDVVLKIAMEVLRLNREVFDNDLDIYSTRYTDTLISLSHRTKLAKTIKADFFVSIHCNQAKRKAAQGIEVYYNETKKGSEELAKLISNGLNDKLGYKNRGVKYGNFQVLRETGFCPGLLLELGFLSNSVEAGHIAKKSSIMAYALLILEILIKYHNYD